MLTWFSYNNGENFYQYWGTKRSASMLYGIFMDAVPIGQYKYPFGFCEDNRYTGETFAKKHQMEKVCIGIILIMQMLNAIYLIDGIII